MKVVYSRLTRNRHGAPQLRIGVANDTGSAWNTWLLDGWKSPQQEKFIGVQLGSLLRKAGTSEPLEVDVKHSRYKETPSAEFFVARPDEEGVRTGAVEQFGEAFQAEEIPF